MFDRYIFSTRISKLRTSHGITQDALSKAIGVNRTTITLVEKGERAVSIEVLYALAEYFEVSADYLLGLSDNPTRR